MLNRKRRTERTGAAGEPDDTRDSRPAQCRSPVVPEGICNTRAKTGRSPAAGAFGTTGTPRKHGDLTCLRVFLPVD
jgi:hypothetical protein